MAVGASGEASPGEGGDVGALNNARSSCDRSLESYGCGSKNRYPNGTLVGGHMDQNLRNPSCLILSHIHIASHLIGDVGVVWRLVGTPIFRPRGFSCCRGVIKLGPWLRDPLGFYLAAVGPLLSRTHALRRPQISLGMRRHCLASAILSEHNLLVVAMAAKHRSTACLSIQVACAAAALACMGIPDLRWKAVLFVYLPFRDAEFVQPWLDSYLDLEMWWSLCPEASCVV